MQRFVRLTFGGAAFLVFTLVLLGASPRAAHSFAKEECDFVGTADSVDLALLADDPQMRTISVEPGSTCLLTLPPGIVRLASIVCGMEVAPVITMGGTWDVTFQSITAGIVPFTTDDISQLTMTPNPFPLCGFMHEVTSHTMDNQTFTFDNNTGFLIGDSRDTISSDLTKPGSKKMKAKAFKFGMYGGTIMDFSPSGGTMTLEFHYDGRWVPRGGLPGLSFVGLGMLAALLMSGGGFLLWRRRALRT